MKKYPNESPTDFLLRLAEEIAFVEISKTKSQDKINKNKNKNKKWNK